jgi:hypothetical protein
MYLENKRPQNVVANVLVFINHISIGMAEIWYFYLLKILANAIIKANVMHILLSSLIFFAYYIIKSGFLTIF